MVPYLLYLVIGVIRGDFATKPIKHFAKINLNSCSLTINIKIKNNLIYQICLLFRAHSSHLLCCHLQKCWIYIHPFRIIFS